MAKDTVSIDQLIEELHNPDTFVRSNAARELGKLRDPRATSALIHCLEDRDWKNRRNAAQALGASRSAEAVEPLIAALKDRTMTVRSRAAVALGRIKDKRAIPPLIARLLSDDDGQVIESCSQALRKFGKACVPQLTAALSSAGPKQQLTLLSLLAEIPGALVVEPLAVLAEDPDPKLRYQAVYILSQAKNDARALEILLGALYDQDYLVRSAAAGAVSKYSDPRVAPALLDQLRDYELYGPRQQIYQAVTHAFRRMAGMPEDSSPILSVNPVGLAGAFSSMGQEEQLKLFTSQLTGMFQNFASLFNPTAELPPAMRKAQDMIFTLRNAESIAIAQVDALLKQVSSPQPLERMAAAVCLAWYGDARALKPLGNLTTTDPDPDVRLAAGWAGGSLEKFLSDRETRV